MRDNYLKALSLVLKHEGGYVNDPQDPGGATNKGITQKTYDAWRVRETLSKRSVRLINFWEITEIYRKQYWDKIKGDDLPLGVDYCVFDFAVNSGTDRAAKYLQRAVGAVEDGQIGPNTLAKVASRPDDIVIDFVCDERLAFMKRQPTWEHFKNGWSERVKEVRANAKEMAK